MSLLTNTIGPHVSTRDFDQRQVVVLNAELATRRHLTQPAREVPRPSMERAADLTELGARALTQLAAAVATHVLKGAEHAVVATHDQRRIRAEPVLEEVSGLAQHGRRCTRTARRAATGVRSSSAANAGSM